MFDEQKNPGRYCGTGHKSFARLSYHHPHREATRKIRAATERVLRVTIAFNALEADEQHLVAERLAQIMQAGEPIPAFDDVEIEAENWAALASDRELQAYIIAAFLRLPRHERQRAIQALGRLA